MSNFGLFLLFVSPLLLAMFGCLCAIAFCVLHYVYLECRDLWRKYQ